MIIALSKLDIWKEAVIKQVESGQEFQMRIASIGLRVGKTVRKTTSGHFNGPIVVEVDRASVAIWRGMAMNVFVGVKE